jgi:hypothetical protein
MARTPKAKTTETTKKTSVKKAVVKKTEEPKAEPEKKTHGTYMDENGVIDWDKLKALLK